LPRKLRNGDALAVGRDDHRGIGERAIAEVDEAAVRIESIDLAAERGRTVGAEDDRRG
jgi:hypothetical protein